MTFSTSLTSLGTTGGRPADNDWMDDLDALGKRDTYHLPGYQRLTSPTGYETVFCSFRCGVWAVGLPLTLRPLPEAVRRATGYDYDATSVYGYPGPLLARRDSATIGAGHAGGLGDHGRTPAASHDRRQTHATGAEHGVETTATTDADARSATAAGPADPADPADSAPATDAADTGHAGHANQTGHTSHTSHTGHAARSAPDADWRAGFCEAVAELCAKLGVLTAFIRNHPLYDASELFDGPAFQLGAATPTVAIDLRRPEDERLARASGHHRRALRKAAAHGLCFERDHSSSAVAAFATCYAETMARVAASSSYLLRAEQVQLMLDQLGEHAELWVARTREGEVASAAIFLRTDGVLQYHLGGTRHRDYPLGAARPLFEAVAEDAHQRGDRWLHLGGGVGGDDDSLLRYKGGFGPDRFRYRTIRAVFDNEAYAAAVRAVGHDRDSGFFPAYRTGGLGVLPS